jgi:hypothetical protein
MIDDPVLTAIAATTNDALPDHLWRYDTGADEPIGDLACILHSAAAEFTGTTQVLGRALHRLHRRCGEHLQTLTSHAGLIRLHVMDTDALTLIQLLERHQLHRDALLTAYAAWRRHRPASLDPQVHHLLPAPYLPTSGRITLTATDQHTWLVTPDQTAAAAYGTDHAGQIIGHIQATGNGWQPTAYTHPQHQQTHPHLVYPLPPVEDQAAACRSLLRWWALRESPTWDGRTPDQLTSHEQAALSA